MRCPFPGMDPFIERPEIFPDFHDSFITYLRAALRPLLRPKYVPVTQDRVFVVEAERSRYPDVAVVRTPFPASAPGTAVLEKADQPAVFELWREEIRQPFLTIVEPAMGNRIVTAIEVLSPSNKQPGEGRVSYLEKRDGLWDSGVNLVPRRNYGRPQGN